MKFVLLAALLLLKNEDILALVVKAARPCIIIIVTHGTIGTCCSNGNSPARWVGQNTLILPFQNLH